MLKQSTLFVSPPPAQQCFKPPPSLFLVFMITKITNGLISWESEQLWATLQEWHCSSVCKFLCGKVIYYSAYHNTVRLGTNSLHILMLHATTYFSQGSALCPFLLQLKYKTKWFFLCRKTKCILSTRSKLCKVLNRKAINMVKTKHVISKFLIQSYTLNYAKILGNI